MPRIPLLHQSVASVAGDLALRGVKYDDELNTVSAALTFTHSRERRWWRHDACGHTWDAECYSVTRGCGCPFRPCNRNATRLCGTCATCRSFSQADDQHVADLASRGIVYDVARNAVPAALTSKHSNEKRWWQHDACGHSWEAKCEHMSSGGCPFPTCNRASFRLCGFCASCISFSIADDQIVADLAARGIVYDAARNTEPAALTAKRSHEKRWWRHDACGHSWEAKCKHMSSRGQGCPFPTCNRASFRLCGFCASCISFSIADDQIVADLAARGIVYDAARNTEPAALTAKRSHEKRWWRHDACGHTWDASSEDVVTKGRGCPFRPCNRIATRLCGSCATCLSFSQADDQHVADLAARGVVYDASRNTVPAALTSVHSGAKRWWRHDACGHSWEAVCSYIGKGRGCPVCKNKTEALVRSCAAALASGEGWSVCSGSLDWCRNVATGRVLPFDVALADATGTVRGVVEVDGVQHFADMDFFHSVRIDRVRQDTFKAWTAMQRGLFLIRIAQEDVYGDAWPCWRTELGAALARAMQAAQGYAAYLSASPTLYDGHRAALADAARDGCAPYARPDDPEPEADGGTSADEGEGGSPDTAPPEPVAKRARQSGQTLLSAWLV